MNKLNGWRRLWIVASVIWLALVAFVSILEWPSEEEAWAEYLDLYISAVQKENTRLKNASKQVILDELNYPTTKQFVMALDSEFSGKVPFDRIALDNLRKIDAIQKEKKTIMMNSLYSTSPILIIYILGWSVAWIRKGFAKQNDT